MDKQIVAEYVAKINEMLEIGEGDREVLFALRRDALQVLSGKAESCWICEDHGESMVLPSYRRIRPAVEDLDVCEECLRMILESASCRECGTSIPTEEALAAYRNAGHTHGVSLECLGCNPQEDGTPYWTER